MTATNHALTGAFIGLIVGQPLIALPAALASHFVCDALPHFGRNMPEKALLKSAWFRHYLILEFVVCVAIVAALAVFQPQHWQLAVICAFAAASPDLLSLPRYLDAVRNKHWQHNWYTRFAKDIQWFERPIGGVVEIVWFAAMITMMASLFH